ncbi:MAG: TetR/AcrR family transcriptional regulator [Actinomycetota bacterium]|nr:TetR/AcrR family transcriptional regulator [Actinomycetota bacterium]
MSVRKRLTRAEKQAETRQALLDSAARVFARVGLQAATVEEITEEAGFSRGAFYSNFEDKGDLFLTLLEKRGTQEMEEIALAFQKGDTAEERLVNGGRFIDAMAIGKTEWCRLYMEFWAASVRDRKLRRRFAQQYEMWRSGIAQMIDAGARDLGMTLDAPAEELASAVIALSEGYVLQKLIDPAALPDDYFSRILVRFFRRFGAFEELDAR